MNRKGAFAEQGAIPQPDPEAQWLGFHVGHTNNVDGTSVLDGDMTFYMVVTPVSTTNTLFNIIYNELFGADIEIDDGNGIGRVAYANLSKGMASGSKPAAGTPCLIAITLNGVESGSYKIYNAASGNTPVHSTTLSGTPNANLLFHNPTTVARAGIELFGRVTFQNNANTAFAMAEPGFTVHEVLHYAEAHTTAQQADVREWAEEKWGV